MLENFAKLSVPFHHVVGNHELYNFDPMQLQKNLMTRGLYYDFSPHPGWRFIILNTYDVISHLICLGVCDERID